jgi:probable addiction module antidote protein
MQGENSGAHSERWLLFCLFDIKVTVLSQVGRQIHIIGAGTKKTQQRIFGRPSNFGVSMHRKSRPFQDLLLERLADAEVAKHYLNEALEESQESFLKALKTVAQARQMAKVAKEAGVQRETLYRSLLEGGNPTLDTLSSVLKAVGLKISIGIEGVDEPTEGRARLQKIR